MKTKNKEIEKSFDTVKVFREIKNSISKDLYGKSADQIMEYLKKGSLKLQADK